MEKTVRRRIFFITMCALHSYSGLHSQTYGWKKVMQLPASLQTVFFIDSLHGWTAGSSAQIFRTTDGGTSWVQYSSDAPFNVKSISMVDSLNGWCVGFNGGNDGWIAHTTDGGKTWPSQFERDRRQYFGTHVFSLTENIISGQTKNSASPDTGKIVETTDGGTTWKETTPCDSVGSNNKIQFLDSLNGFVWGNPPLRTRDGGKTWQKLPRDDRIGSPSFIDSLRGWGGYNWLMFHTTDGGFTWQYQANLDIPDQLLMKDIEFVDSLNGWAFGDRFYMGTGVDCVFRTTDGGKTWYQEAVAVAQTQNIIIDAQMWNKNLGWAVCNDGSVLRYQLITSVVEKIPERQPKTFVLRQNYPNPFNPSTSIVYELKGHQTVTLFITDALGKQVETVLNNQAQEAGVYQVRFNGSSLASGIYFYTIQTEQFNDTKQMILIK